MSNVTFDLYLLRSLNGFYFLGGKGQKYKTPKFCQKVTLDKSTTWQRSETISFIDHRFILVGSSVDIGHFHAHKAWLAPISTAKHRLWKNGSVATPKGTLLRT